MAVFYSEQQKVAILATLAANHGNISKTARETGVDRMTLRAWRESELANSPEVATIKSQVEHSFLNELLNTRSAAQKKMAELIAKADSPEHLRDVTGAFKILNDAAGDLETQREIAQAIAQATAERLGETN